MPQAGTLQAGEVRRMFDRIAGVYDPLNTAMTAGLHHRWRERAVDMARLRPGARARVLDVAAGTGDLTLALARRIGPGGEVLGSDFSEGMLARARAKAAAVHGAAETCFEWGDALELPYGDDAFDAATVGFGARNFADLSKGMRELVRVVRPGGRVVVLELATPTRPPLSLFYRLWFDRLIPLLAKLMGLATALLARLRPTAPADAIADAYNYLPNSVKRWPAPPELAAEMERAGLVEISYVLLAGGVVAVHAGTVPGEDAGASGKGGAATSAASNGSGSVAA
jgi:demethylmenaquinone methyltransferase / 2-methoxy-6-polyprenyl-1,4-benzoquinol methylase